MSSKDLYKFGEFVLDARDYVLTREDKSTSLTPKMFEVLNLLIEHRGRIVSKEVLMTEVWADSFVEDGNLAVTIRQLRKALDDDAFKPKYIETVSRRGYRFIAEVELDDGLSETETHLLNGEVKSSPGLLPSDVPRRVPFTKILVGFAVAVVLISAGYGAYLALRGAPIAASRQFRLKIKDRVTNAVVSPNGKNIVFAQKEVDGESLWLRQIDTGDQILLLPPENVNFVGLTVSPDNRYAYYSAFSKNSAVVTLSRIPLDGGAAEPLPDVATDASVSFSPNGKELAFTESQTSVNETYLKVANADGSNQRTLITLKGDARELPIFRASPVSWSPDGKIIACAVREQGETRTAYKIALVDPIDGSEKYISERSWNFVESIAWKDPDHLTLIERVADPPSEQIWKISRKTGEAVQLTEGLNHYEWLSSANGNLFTVQKSHFSSLHVAEVNKYTEALKPKQVLSDFGFIENVMWTTEEKLLYNSIVSGKNEIWRMNSDGTGLQQLTVNSNLVGVFATSPADNSLVFLTSQDGRRSLNAADANGKNMRSLTDGISDAAPSFAPDGKTVIFQRGSLEPMLWRIGLEPGHEPEQLTGYFSLSPSVSPDGKKIAFQFMDFGGKTAHWKLGIVSSDDRRFLQKLELPRAVTERKMTWHPTRNLVTLLFNTELLLISPEDGTFQMLETTAGGTITSFAWSTDGTRFAFAQTFEANDIISVDEL